MIATILIVIFTVLVVSLIIGADILRRRHGKKSFFTEEECGHGLSSKRLVYEFHKQKKRETKAQ